VRMFQSSSLVAPACYFARCFLPAAPSSLLSDLYPNALFHLPLQCALHCLSVVSFFPALNYCLTLPSLLFAPYHLLYILCTLPSALSSDSDSLIFVYIPVSERMTTPPKESPFFTVCTLKGKECRSHHSPISFSLLSESINVTL
jgi:hypothetical protein